MAGRREFEMVRPFQNTGIVGRSIPKSAAACVENIARASATDIPSHCAAFFTPQSGVKHDPAKFCCPGWRTTPSLDSTVMPPNEYSPGGAPAADMASVVKMTFPAGLARKRFFNTEGGRWTPSGMRQAVSSSRASSL